jgi:hypothetical protein
MMTAAARSGRDDATSIGKAVDGVFGRWPAWPWSVLALVVAGGIAGWFAAPALRAADVARPAALGTFACAGYGMLLAAFLSLLPRVGKLMALHGGATRRPGTVDEAWWPLRLLPAALAVTPTLRRTPAEFTAAVDAAADRARAMLAHRLWPVWVAAFVAPVLGLITAWQNGAMVQTRFRHDDDSAATVIPAIISQVSPPMVATIAASLALMVVVVAIDQWTKGLLQRWRGVVDVADGEHPAVVDRLGLEEVVGRSGTAQVTEVKSAPPPLPLPQEEKLTTHPLGHAKLGQLWNQSGAGESR